MNGSLKSFSIILMLCLCTASAMAQRGLRMKWTNSGVFSVGLRSGVALSSDASGWNIGQGLGLQSRILLNRHINTEWFFEYFHGGFAQHAVRTDGHIGGSILLYPQRRAQRVAPFLAIGPDADYVKLRDETDKESFVSRWAPALHAGVGMHINLTARTDMTISAGYMLHFGSNLYLPADEAAVVLPRAGSAMDGHFIVNLSFNYKMTDLWKRLRF